MKKLILVFLSVMICGVAWASAPSRSSNYVSGTVIDPNAVMTNENNIYTYLQAGVDTYKAGSITEASISSTAGILYSQLNLAGGLLPTDVNTTTTTSVYTFQNITVPYNATISGTVNIGVTHAGDLFVDNGTSIVRLPDSSVVGEALISQGATTAPIYGFPSGMLGAWRQTEQVSNGAISTGVIYKATTDLFIAAGSTSVKDGLFVISTNSSASLSGQTYSTGYQWNGFANNASYSTTLFVKKNDYYEITVSYSAALSAVYLIPIGT